MNKSRSEKIVAQLSGSRTAKVVFSLPKAKKDEQIFSSLIKAIDTEVAYILEPVTDFDTTLTCVIEKWAELPESTQIQILRIVLDQEKINGRVLSHEQPIGACIS